MEKTEHGLTAATEGWFMVNVRDAAWVTNEKLGDACIFEGEKVPFGQIGYTLAVLQPGEPSAMYHREDADQEDFLVLQGECVAIVEGQERPMRAFDFLHCPPGTAHIFVGAGEGPCVIFMAGARSHKGGEYLRDETALKYGAGPERDTRDAKEAYAPFPPFVPGPPPSYEGLPWA